MCKYFGIMHFTRVIPLPTDGVYLLPKKNVYWDGSPKKLKLCHHLLTLHLFQSYKSIQKFRVSKFFFFIIIIIFFKLTLLFSTNALQFIKSDSLHCYKRFLYQMNAVGFNFFICQRILIKKKSFFQKILPSPNFWTSVGLYIFLFWNTKEKFSKTLSYFQYDESEWGSQMFNSLVQ